MNSCLILIILLFCCGNRSGQDKKEGNNCGCGRDRRDDSRGCRSNVSDNCGCMRGDRDRNDRECDRDRDRDRNDCRESRDNRCFNTFPSPGGTCGCEEKNV